MGKLLRLVIFVIGGLVLLLVAAAIILPLVVDPNDFKDEIATAVESKTGRTLSMEGDIELSVFPWLGLDVGPVSLSNAPGFSARPFASMKAVQVRIKLLPLLSKELEMDTVVLQGLKVSLETDKQGKTNWSDLAGGAESVEEAPEAATESASAAEVTLAGLAIGGVEITDAGVIWDDQQAGTRYEVEGLSLRTGAIEPGEAVPVELKLALNSKQPDISGPVAFTATVALSGDGQTIQLSDAKLTTDLAGAGLPGGQLKSSLGFNSTLDLKAQTLVVSGLLLKAMGLQLEAELNGTAVLDDPKISGEIRVGEFVPREIMQALDLPPLDVSDTAVLGKADAQLQLKATTDSVNLTELRFRLDDSTLNGNLSVTNFAQPAVRFGLQLDQIDVDRYLPPGNDAPPVPPTAAAAAGAQMIPVDTLRALDVEGELKIGKLKVAGLRSSDISMKLEAKSGVVRVYPAKASLYGGKYKGDIKLDVRGRQPKIFMNERLSDIQVGPLLKDMTGTETLSGKTQAGAKLTASGQTPEEFTKTLNGKVNFKFTDGAVKGFNLAAMIRKAQAKLNGKPVPPDTEPNQTDFSSLSGTASITNGVVRNRDLMAMSPLLRIQGTGDIDLPKESLDYVVTAKVVGSLEGQGGKGLLDLKGIEIPVQLSGTFADPKYRIQLDKVLKQKTEKKIKKKLNKELEKKFGDKFKGLFQ
ncbi:MAG: AsmA family protein [Gammaproteobacteria bacterium]|nr:MAG: AsmA family protein [Gammaproteobacteria bacterium]